MRNPSGFSVLSGQALHFPVAWFARQKLLGQRHRPDGMIWLAGQREELAEVEPDGKE